MQVSSLTTVVIAVKENSQKARRAENTVMTLSELSANERNRIFGDMFAPSSPSNKVLQRDSGVKRTVEKRGDTRSKGETKLRGETRR